MKQRTTTGIPSFGNEAMLQPKAKTPTVNQSPANVATLDDQWEQNKREKFYEDNANMVFQILLKNKKTFSFADARQIKGSIPDDLLESMFNKFMDVALEKKMAKVIPSIDGLSNRSKVLYESECI